MTYFIDLRADDRGGNPVADVSDIRVHSYPVASTNAEAELLTAAAGRDLLLATHGFHVNRPDGMERLTHWNKWIVPGPSGFFAGVLWPGDSKWVPFLDYPAEGNEAIRSGELLGEYLTQKFGVTRSVSFASHSLGARMVLQTIQTIVNWKAAIRLGSLTMMAAAIDDTALNSEYAQAAEAMLRISNLASERDDVLKWAFTVANPVAGIVTRGEPYWHGALGRYGPNPPNQPAQLIQTKTIPDQWDFGHDSYINCTGNVGDVEATPFYPPIVDVPGTVDPTSALQLQNCRQAWAAAFVSTRFV
jgi:hypothetical protein